MFRSDEKLTDFLKQHAFTVSAEVIPPRNGADQESVFGQVRRLIASGAQFLSVTKGAGGSLRGGSLPIALAIKEQLKVPAIAHFTCRDLVPEEVENLLMDHHYFGVRNILALRGDPPDGQTDWHARPGGYSYAHELITQIKNLNEGQFLARKGAAPTQAARPPSPTQFCIGCAVYPEHPNLEERTRFLRDKVAAGAEYAITNMLFDLEGYARFLDDVDGADIQIPILPGTRILKTRSQAEKMAEKFKVKVPDEFMRALPGPGDAPSPRAGIDLFLKQVERLKQLGAPGIHLFVISDTESAADALREIRNDRP